MRVDLSGPLASSPAAGQAAAIVEACVHCGLCTATCPTYEVLDQEADSPRGRIYLIRELLQGASASAHTREHLDRCLGCRACETACPSGVQYGHLIDFGRREAERQAPRPLHQRLWRRLLRQGLTSPRLFAAALRLGQALRPVLPAGLVRRVPPRPATLAWPSIAGPLPA